MNPVTSSTGWSYTPTGPEGDRELFERFNLTELYQMCRRAGILAPASSSKKQLIDYYLGIENPPAIPHPIESLRHGLVGLVRDYWSRLETQISCPAKILGIPPKPDDPPIDDPLHPKACFGCEDQKVIACIVETTAGQEHLIQIRRKDTIRHYPEIDIMSILDIANAPRNPADLGKLQRFQLRALADKLGKLSDTASKTAFLDLNTDIQAQQIAGWLSEIDARGGAPASGVQAQPQAPQTGGAGLPSMPAAGAMGGQAGGVLGGFGAPGYGVQNLPGVGISQPQAGQPVSQPQAPQNNAEVLGVLNQLAMAVNQSATAVIQHVSALDGQRVSTDQSLRQAIEGLTNVLKLSIGCTLVVAENQMGMPPKDVLEQAGEMVQRYLTEGKAV